MRKTRQTSGERIVKDVKRCHFCLYGRQKLIGLKSAQVSRWVRGLNRPKKDARVTSKIRRKAF